MITQDEILAELEGCEEPEKKLFEIADREGQPVMVIRKILRDLVTIMPPEKFPPWSEDPHYSYSRSWRDEDVETARRYWLTGATIPEIAELTNHTDAQVRGLIQVNRDIFSKQNKEWRVWSSEEIVRAADMWRDPTLTAADICIALNRGINDFYQLRAENPALFKPRRARRINSEVD